MSPEVAKNFAMALAIAIGAGAPAIAMGMIASKAMEAIGRNPETANAVRTTLVIALVFPELAVLFSFLVALIMKFVA